MFENLSETLVEATAGVVNTMVVFTIIIYALMLIIPFIFIVFIIWLIVNERQKRRKLQAEIYSKSIEKGEPLQKDLFAESKRKPLHTGIILISSGMGIMLVFWLMAASKLVPLGLLPFMVGLAYVIIHLIDKNNKDEDNAR